MVLKRMDKLEIDKAVQERVDDALLIYWARLASQFKEIQMKITREQLKQLIKEELSQVQNENPEVEVVASCYKPSPKRNINLKQLATQDREISETVSELLSAMVIDDADDILCRRRNRAHFRGIK